MNFRKILVAIDLSEASETALSRAATIAAASGAELHVLHVIPSLVYRGVAYLEPLAPDVQERERASAEKALAEAVDRLEVGDSATTIDVLEGEPRSVILRRADKIGADLIVIASKGHGRLHDILLGSVANHISHAATCSVLIVKG